MSISLMIAIASLFGLLPLIVRALVPVVRRLRTPSELRGNWWARFEHDFHAYTHLREHQRNAGSGDRTGGDPLDRGGAGHPGRGGVGRPGWPRWDR